MTDKEMSKLIAETVRKAYQSGYKDGYFDGANEVINRVDKLRTEYINPDNYTGEINDN